MSKKSIFIISDLHMQFSYYEEVIPKNLSLLILAGDLLSFGNPEEARFACNFLEGLIEDHNVKEIIWVLGNHDVSVSKDIEYYKAMYPKINFKLKEEFIWNDIKFFVTGYSPFVQERWTNFYRDQFEEKNVMLPQDVPDVIISHCPPSHPEFSTVADFRVDIGSMELRNFIEHNKVKFCFNGHLHIEYAKNYKEYIEINGCQCFNVSSQGQLLSLENGILKLEEYSPSLKHHIYWECRKKGVRYDHLDFMKFIQYWKNETPVSEEFYEIMWSMSGVQFSTLSEEELEKLKTFFQKYYSPCPPIQSNLLLKFN